MTQTTMSELARSIAGQIRNQPEPAAPQSPLTFADQAARAQPDDQASELRSQVAKAIGVETSPRLTAGGLRWAV